MVAHASPARRAAAMFRPCLRQYCRLWFYFLATGHDQNGNAPERGKSRRDFGAPVCLCCGFHLVVGPLFGPHRETETSRVCPDVLRRDLFRLERGAWAARRGCTRLALPNRSMRLWLASGILDAADGIVHRTLAGRIRRADQFGREPRRVHRTSSHRIFVDYGLSTSSGFSSFAVLLRSRRLNGLRPPKAAAKVVIPQCRILKGNRQSSPAHVNQVNLASHWDLKASAITIASATLALAFVSIAALGQQPDSTASNRGQKLFVAKCSFCHGEDARGRSGPDLIRSPTVLDDKKGI